MTPDSTNSHLNKRPYTQYRWYNKTNERHMIKHYLKKRKKYINKTTQVKQDTHGPEIAMQICIYDKNFKGKKCVHQ